MCLRGVILDDVGNVERTGCFANVTFSKCLKVFGALLFLLATIGSILALIPRIEMSLPLKIVSGSAFGVMFIGGCIYLYRRCAPKTQIKEGAQNPKNINTLTALRVEFFNMTTMKQCLEYLENNNGRLDLKHIKDYIGALQVIVSSPKIKKDHATANDFFDTELNTVAEHIKASKEKGEWQDVYMDLLGLKNSMERFGLTWPQVTFIQNGRPWTL